MDFSERTAFHRIVGYGMIHTPGNADIDLDLILLETRLNRSGQSGVFVYDAAIGKPEELLLPR